MMLSPPYPCWDVIGQVTRGSCQRMPWLVARRYLSVTPASPPNIITRFLLRLSQQFYDVEQFLNWSSTFRNRLVRRKNLFYGYAKQNYGDNIAAAYYILSLKGSFRFAGQTEWFRPNARGRFSYEFMTFPDSMIEDVDLSGTPINCDGLDNIVSQLQLRRLTLRSCPEVDGWFLTRLHIFSDTLEELDISHCPRVTVGALCALQHLRKLRHLDISGLPSVHNPGLLRILVEEMLPHCLVAGAEYSQGLEDTMQTNIQQTSINQPTAPEAQPHAEESGKTSTQRQG
ncbi:distal membrane-arm assembly complex protein 2 isoform X1 [Alosa sapidissima]|uniref:distal membrane-arm assembly complex protein 2 isoform X1 n=1 Tax=Alosa sapidissima TaxID=34773 RepID=UPI001C091D0E|nr:distal membrane-arm assembly complex protein 2 isoform X1 [Alosa sapidissima]